PDQILPAVANGAPAGPQQADDGAQEGALAGAVAPYEGHHLVLPNLEGNPVEHLRKAVAGDHVLDRQHHPLTSSPRYTSRTRGFWRMASGVSPASSCPRCCT